MIRSIKSRVLTRIVEKENKVGGIILAKERKEFQIGEVVHCGESVTKEIKIGDLVFAHASSGLVLDCDGIPYVSFREEELLAIVDSI